MKARKSAAAAPGAASANPFGGFNLQVPSTSGSTPPSAPVPQKQKDAAEVEVRLAPFTATEQQECNTHKRLTC